MHLSTEILYEVDEDFVFLIPNETLIIQPIAKGLGIIGQVMKREN